jgi:hypothetical protein
VAAADTDDDTAPAADESIPKPAAEEAAPGGYAISIFIN